MKFFTLIAALFFAAQLSAQDVEGYYITESGKKVNGFFKYGDFFETASLKFKQSRSGEFAVLPQGVVEYGAVDEKLIFEKHKVKIDFSGNNSNDKDPQWSTQEVFLNVLLKGKATLYSYTSNYKTVFFFSVESAQEQIDQLVYKQYILEDGTVAENKMFRQQLFNAVKCDGEQISDFTDIAYAQNKLIEVFQKYNKCKGVKSKVYGVKKSNFRYSAFAGIHSLNVGIDSAVPPVSDQTNVNYTFGGEIAYVFPSEGPSLFFRIEYESLNSENVDSYDKVYNVFESSYKLSGSAFNFIFGPRYNFQITNKHSLYVDAGFCFSAPVADIKRTTLIHPVNGTPYNGEYSSFDLTPAFGLNFGIGYNFGRYGVAARYVTKRDFLDDTLSSFKTEISRLGLIVSYTIN
ncbi:hypothetical protein ACX0HA_07375 [Flavobacterium hauense]